MASTLFASGFSLTATLPSVRAVTTNSLFLSNLNLISRRRIHSLTSVGRRGKTVLSPSSTTTSSSSSVLKITCGVVKEIKEETEFSEVVLKSDRPVLVEFVATWCGPCRLIAPALESLAKEYEDKLAIIKVDHDLNPQLIKEYNVFGLPALILFKNGEEVPESRREGAISKAKLKDYIDGLLKLVSIA